MLAYLETHTRGVLNCRVLSIYLDRTPNDPGEYMAEVKITSESDPVFPKGWIGAFPLSRVWARPNCRKGHLRGSGRVYLECVQPYHWRDIAPSLYRN